MVQTTQATDVTLYDLKEKFGLLRSSDEKFFAEWLDDLPKLSDLEEKYLDRVKTNFLNLVERHFVLEDTVKMVVLSPLLDLAGFYSDPFQITTEAPIEIPVAENDEIIKGKIDVLVLNDRLWLMVIESKRARFSVIETLAQSLTYMLSSPDSAKPIFGLITNGSEFLFLKLLKQEKKIPRYALSEQFTLLNRYNELYQVLSVLKKLGQLSLT
jgi:Type I restriction enzyme R protein N terminus (HSDR_N)